MPQGSGPGRVFWQFSKGPHAGGGPQGGGPGGAGGGPRLFAPFHLAIDETGSEYPATFDDG